MKRRNFANMINMKHISQGSINIHHQKERKINFRSISCLNRTFRRASKIQKGGNQILKRLKVKDKRRISAKRLSISSPAKATIAHGCIVDPR